MSQLPEQHPAPITLDYQRLEKRRKRVVGGLLLFSGFLCLLVLLGSWPMAIEALRHARGDPLFLAEAVLPITVAGTYFAMAILFQRRVQWAGWVALVISALLALGFFFLLSMISYDQMTGNRYDPVWLIILGDTLLLLISLGPVVVCIEILWALRNPAI